MAKVKPAPEWAKNARILSAVYEDIAFLKRTREEFGATVVLLYCSPEVTNGWCPRGTWIHVKDFIQEAHKNGLKVICYYDTTLVEESFYSEADHANWVQKNEHGAPQHYQPAHIIPQRYAYCFNSPWSDHVIGIVKRYFASGADGIFLDNPQYYSFTGKTCFCDYCKERFKKETGRSILFASDDARTDWLSQCISEHVFRINSSIEYVSEGSSLVITCNTSGSDPTRSLSTLGQSENVLFCEIVTGEKGAIDKLNKDRKMFLNKPLWVILTEPPGSQKWSKDINAATKDIDSLLGTVFNINACPMVWSDIPSQDPDKPGFTGLSIYREPVLAEVVKKYFSRK